MSEHHVLIALLQRASELLWSNRRTFLSLTIPKLPSLSYFKPHLTYEGTLISRANNDKCSPGKLVAVSASSFFTGMVLLTALCLILSVQRNLRLIATFTGASHCIGRDATSNFVSKLAISVAVNSCPVSVKWIRRRPCRLSRTMPGETIVPTPMTLRIWQNLRAVCSPFETGFVAPFRKRYSCIPFHMTYSNCY
jgi:hypothetical protein